MIRDASALTEGAILQATVGIVGAGPVGIDLARFLGRRGLRTVLLESGRDGFDPEIQALGRVRSVGKTLRTPDPDGPFTPYLEPRFRGEFRIRQFGGTSNIWTGKWRRFDDLDFTERPWVPFSGWPVSLRELEPYYREIEEEYGLASFDAFARSPEFARAREVMDPAGLKLSFHYWQASTARPAERFRDELARSQAVEVVLGANATEIVLNDNRERVEAVRFRSLDGRRFTLQADRFVLAMGGMEGARLMLASNRQVPEGVGNASGLVGRFHMDHPKTKRARLWPGPAMRCIEPWTETRRRPCFHVSLSLADRVQEARHLLDHAVYLSPVYQWEVDFPRPAVAAVKRALRSGDVVGGAAATLALLRSPRDLRKLFGRWRHGQVGGRVAHYVVSLYMEQAPNAESRLSLDDDTDALGMPRLRVDWRLTPLDHQALDGVKRGLSEAVTRAGLGRLEFDEPLTLDDMADAAHHIGATRMAATPETGVVDLDCRVFGTHNLFIASSSVFPTGHSAAPTLTILALARRLAKHLLAQHADAERRVHA